MLDCMTVISVSALATGDKLPDSSNVPFEACLRAGEEGDSGLFRRGSVET